MSAEAKGLGLGVLAMALWALTRKPAAVEPPLPKQPIVEQPHISLPEWQELTPEQLAPLPVNTAKDIPIGSETYNPTPQPVAIGNTGFSIWGTTESGATVVSKNEPSTYAAWEWS